MKRNLNLVVFIKNIQIFTIFFIFLYQIFKKISLQIVIAKLKRFNFSLNDFFNDLL